MGSSTRAYKNRSLKMEERQCAHPTCRCKMIVLEEDASIFCCKDCEYGRPRKLGELEKIVLRSFTMDLSNE